MSTDRVHFPGIGLGLRGPCQRPLGMDLFLPAGFNRTRKHLLFGFFFVLANCCPAWAAPHMFLGVGGGGAGVSVEVTSFKEAKYRSVIKQQYDFSCGSAALASLLTYHYGITTTEEDAFEAMFAAGDKEKIRKKGFSLLDMKRYLAHRGMRSDGYRIPLEKVAALGVPVIVLINTGGYKHFVIVKGIENGMVLVGDPAKGLTKIRRADFDEINQGIVFLIIDKAKIAKASFNDESDWKARPKAPIGAPDSQIGASNFSLMLPSPGDF